MRRLVGDLLLLARADARRENPRRPTDVGEVVILDYKQAESCIQRVKGCKDVVEKHNKGRSSGKLEIVAELPGQTERRERPRRPEPVARLDVPVRGIPPAGLGVAV